MYMYLSTIVSTLSFSFSSGRCQWVLPCRTNQDCISEQQKSELLAISSSLDFHWFSVSEVEREGSVQDESGGGEDEKDKDKEGDGTVLMIERLAPVLKKKDLGSELSSLDHCELYCPRISSLSCLCFSTVY